MAHEPTERNYLKLKMKISTLLIIVLYPEEGSIAETSVKQLLKASKFSFLI